jgi:hypothetical protein
MGADPGLGTAPFGPEICHLTGAATPGPAYRAAPREPPIAEGPEPGGTLFLN